MNIIKWCYKENIRAVCRIARKMNTLFLYVLILFWVSGFCARRQYIHPVDDEQYPILLKLAGGNFKTPVHERSKKEKSAVVKFWRAKGKFEIKDGVLMYDDKQVMTIFVILHLSSVTVGKLTSYVEKYLKWFLDLVPVLYLLK